MTRIVAGSVGGRRIAVPDRGTRPTSERVREALFNALESAMDLHGARVLDLYAGSGALGLEALSRGAAHVLFVESDKRAARLLRRNVRALGFAGVHIEQAKVETVLSSTESEPYDVVLADPPYAVDTARLEWIAALLSSRGWTASGSTLVVERATLGDEPCWPESWESLRTRRYGDTSLHWAVRR